MLQTYLGRFTNQRTIESVCQAVHTSGSAPSKLFGQCRPCSWKIASIVWVKAREIANFAAWVTIVFSRGLLLNYSDGRIHQLISLISFHGDESFRCILEKLTPHPSKAPLWQTSSVEWWAHNDVNTCMNDRSQPTDPWDEESISRHPWVRPFWRKLAIQVTDQLRVSWGHSSGERWHREPLTAARCSSWHSCL